MIEELSSASIMSPCLWVTWNGVSDFISAALASGCLTGYVEAAHERVAMLKLKDIVLELLSVDEWPTERLRTACLNYKHPLFYHGKRRRRSAAASGQDPSLPLRRQISAGSQTSAWMDRLLPSCAARTANGSSCCRIRTTQSSDLREAS